MGLLYRQRTRSLKDLSNKLLEAIAIENQLKSQTMIQGCKFPAKKAEPTLITVWNATSGILYGFYFSPRILFLRSVDCCLQKIEVAT